MHFNSELSFDWLLSRNITEVKELSRAILACHVWDVENDLAPKLIRLKKEGSWNHSLRDTARAASSLAAIGMVFPDVGEWMLSEQERASWNEDVYDTTYALIALADMGIRNVEGCSWLVDNYGPSWEYPGTTSLVLQALLLQGKLGGLPDEKEFVLDRVKWLLSRRSPEGDWETIATSNLVMQALILAGYGRELGASKQRLFSLMNNNGSWGKDAGDVTATSLSLVTLGYLIHRGI